MARNRKTSLWSFLNPRVSLMLLGCASLGMQCAPFPPCVPGVEKGSSYEISLVDEYDEETATRFEPLQTAPYQTAPRCGSVDGLANGESIDIRVTGTEDAVQCFRYVGRVTSRSSVTLADRQKQPFAEGDFLVAWHQATMPNGCTGWWGLDLRSPEEKPFGMVVPGDLPPVIALRAFWPARVADCPGLAPEVTKDPYVCADAWVATLRKK